MSEQDAISQIEAILLDEIDDLSSRAVHGPVNSVGPAIRQIAIRISRVIDLARERSGES